MLSKDKFEFTDDEWEYLPIQLKPLDWSDKVYITEDVIEWMKECNRKSKLVNLPLSSKYKRR